MSPFSSGLSRSRPLSYPQTRDTWSVVWEFYPIWANGYCTVLNSWYIGELPEASLDHTARDLFGPSTQNSIISNVFSMHLHFSLIGVLALFLSAHLSSITDHRNERGREQKVVDMNYEHIDGDRLYSLIDVSLNMNDINAARFHNLVTS